MESVTLWRYLASATTMPFVIPIVAILMPKWRYPYKTIIAMALGLEAVNIGLDVLFPLLLGINVLSTWIAGVLLPILGFGVFFFCTSLRGGQLLFIVTTIMLDTTICEVITGVFVTRYQWQWVFIKGAITLIHAVILWFFCRKPLREMMEANQVNWGHTSLIPIALFASLLGVFLSLSQLSQRRLALVPALLLCCAVVLVYIGLYRFQKATLNQADIRQYNALLRSEISFLERAGKQAESTANDARILRHDLRHYTRMLRGCLDTGDTVTAMEILDLLERNTDAVATLGKVTHYTGLAVLDTVLTQAAQRAKAAGIDFNVRLALPKNLPVDPTELAVVISNALENAFNALEKEPVGKPRWLTVAEKPQGGQHLLQISNSFSGVLQQDPKTSLPITDAQGHGYGMQSILSFARKNDCVLDCSLQDGVFSLRLLI